MVRFNEQNLKDIVNLAEEAIEMHRQNIAKGGDVKTSYVNEELEIILRYRDLKEKAMLQLNREGIL